MPFIRFGEQSKCICTRIKRAVEKGKGTEKDSIIFVKRGERERERVYVSHRTNDSFAYRGREKVALIVFILEFCRTQSFII